MKEAIEWGPCSECGATTTYADDYECWPDGWTRVEDNALVTVFCSVACLRRYFSGQSPAAGRVASAGDRITSPAPENTGIGRSDLHGQPAIDQEQG